MTPVQYFHIAQSLIKEHFKHLFVLTKQICKYPVKFLCLVAAFSLIYIATLLPAERDQQQPSQYKNQLNTVGQISMC